MSLLRIFQPPADLSKTERRNYRNLQIDAIGVGLASAITPFLPVFLTHLNASSFQVGLLTSMPALAGLILSIPLGRFLQRQNKTIKWFTISRLAVIVCYALAVLAVLFLPEKLISIAVLATWALASIPQTMVNIAVTLVINEVAGPSHRFQLLTLRWTVMGVSTSLCVLGIGQLLDFVSFPLNYQIMFIVLVVGALVSCLNSLQITLSVRTPAPLSYENKPFKDQLIEYKNLILKEKPYLSFIFKRFIFLTGTALATPLIPLYLVKVVHASDGWISIINMVQTAVVVFGYFAWSRLSRRRGSHKVLLWTSLGVSLYTLAMALTRSTWLITFYAGLCGIFQSGVDLVFFDELMRLVPPEYSAIFVSISQSVQYLSSVFAPVVGTTIGDSFGLGVGLIIAAAIRFMGFALFLFPIKKAKTA